MEKKREKGKIIPFRQEAAFYLKRGAKEMGRNDLVSALYQYRRAYLDNPLDPETCLAVAEILSQMQRFEESNRILMVQLSMGEPVPETYFGIACNYFGMHEFEYAAENLERYLDEEPDGYYALEAEEFLDFIDDDDAMAESTGLYTDEDYDTDAAVIEARHLMDSMDIQGAIDILEDHVKRYPAATKAKNQLSLAYYCNGERKKAIALVNRVLESDGNNAQALCNSALFLNSIGDSERALAVLRTIQQLPDASAPDVLHNLAVLQLEFKLYSDALKTLTELLRAMPYDENVLHKLGYCRFMLDDADGALECYKKLLRIDPDDTVAKYYFSVCKRNDSRKAGLASRWCIPYQVPFAEAFRRLNQINRYLSESHDAQKKLWETDAHFKNLILWALGLSENRAKNAMLALVFSYGDREAERVLRDFLLRTDQPDEAKRVVFGMLKRMHAKEPYLAYLNGDWISSRINMIEYPDRMPAAYESVIEQLIMNTAGLKNENCVSEAVAILKAYLDRWTDRVPRISRMQEISLAAGLEYLGCRAAGAEVSEEEICKKYRISPLRLHNAVNKLTAPPEEA